MYLAKFKQRIKQYQYLVRMNGVSQTASVTLQTTDLNLARWLVTRPLLLQSL